MAEELVTSAEAGKPIIVHGKWGIAFWMIGGVSAVIWATQKGRKGRFWWFWGGAIIGGSIGLILDNVGNKGNTTTKA